MKIEAHLYFLFINFGSSLTKSREKLQGIQKSNRQEVIPTCNLQDIPLPINGKKWSCEKQFDDSLMMIPKNTKCKLLCEDGYEVKSRKLAFIFQSLQIKSFHQLNFINQN